MSHPMSDEYFSSDIHPTSLYDSTELSVALLVEKSTGSHKGRAVIWQDKKLYNRAYGNAGMLEGMLHNAGYTRGQFIGIEFPIIFHGDKYDGRLVLPFVDREERGGCYARIKDKDTVVICSRSERQFELSGPDGTVEVPLSALREVGLLPKAQERRSPQISETSQNPFGPHTYVSNPATDEAMSPPEQPTAPYNRYARIYEELLAGKPYNSIATSGGSPEDPYAYIIHWADGSADVIRRTACRYSYAYIKEYLM